MQAKLILALLFLGIKVSVRAECNSTLPVDCAEIKETNPSAQSGVFSVRLSDASSCAEAGGFMSGAVCCKEVVCDMDTMGGGWMVFQKRFNGSVDFYRTWAEYQTGFGSLHGEFWAGNGFLYHFSSQKTYELLVELHENENGCSLYALYSSFSLANSATYDLLLGNYIQGTAGDALAYHANQRFATKDNDAGSCAQQWKGGWWYKGCHNCNLNGLYLDGCTGAGPRSETMVWIQARGHFYSFGRTEMKLRPNSSGNTTLDDKFCRTDSTFIPCPVDCNWNAWSSWSSCEMGQTYRNRTEIPKLYDNTRDCQGSSTELKQCRMTKRGQHFSQKNNCRVPVTNVFATFIPVTKQACAMECFTSVCYGWNFNHLTSHCELFTDSSNAAYSQDFDCYF